MSLSEEQTARVIELAMDLAREGNWQELVDFVDRGVPIDVRDHEGNTMLMLAAYHGHADAVRELIAKGADVNRLNNRNQAPIAGALFKGEDEIVALLREGGADLDAGVPSARQTAEMFGRAHLLE